MYEACPLGNHDPRDGICGTDDDNDGARWCTSGVVVGWEDVCCSLCCQLCTLAQMARHTVDYEEMLHIDTSSRLVKIRYIGYLFSLLTVL